jgi:hypothetical protein
MAGTNSRDYETLYGVGLLDDLHNYFPAVLYEPETFRNVAELLMYIQRQTHRRFDLFTFGQTGYNERRAPAPAPAAIPVSNRVPRAPVNSVAVPTGSISTPVVSVSLAETAPLLQSILRPATFIPQQQDEDTEEDEDFEQVHEMIMGRRSNGSVTTYRNNNTTVQLLSALLNLPNLPLVSTASFPAGFLNPVVVRPTEEQIASATTLRTLESVSAENCAICQDSIGANQEQREITHCHHAFHRGCIDTWFQQNVHCPVCRHDIRENETQEQTES